MPLGQETVLTFGTTIRKRGQARKAKGAGTQNVGLWELRTGHGM